MKPKLNVLRLKQHSIFDQLRLEEALLRVDHQNWCLLNEGTSPAIVLGISGKPELLVNENILQKRSIPLIRRFSGGGTVFVDENTLFFTLICNVDCVKVPCCPTKIFHWSEEIWKPVFKDVDFRLRENDYVIGDKKFGGNAQYMKKNRWLHHSSFLWDYHVESMKALLMPSKTPNYRAKRDHIEFLCCLKEHVKEKSSIHKGLLESLQKTFVLNEVTLESTQHILKQPHRQATTYI